MCLNKFNRRNMGGRLWLITILTRLLCMKLIKSIVNSLPEGVYEVGYDRLISPKNKTIDKVYSVWPVYE